jgi:hypothetical protein
MALTSEDLKSITSIVNQAVTNGLSGLASKSELTQVVSGLATKSELTQVVSGLATKSDLTQAMSSLSTDLDRMEGRLVTAINLLQRDSYSRLDDHDVRIRRLEEAASRS